MKILFIALVLTSSFARAADRTKVLGNIRGAKAKECFRVVDQEGNPVEGARVYGGFMLDSPNDYVLIDGVSDTNGEFVAEGRCKDRLGYQITKENYYKTSGEVLYLCTKADPAVVDGKWQPFGERRTVVLKRILNPIPIDRRGAVRDFPVPAYDVWLGFDFERVAFVAPHGEGKVADVLMRFALYKPSDVEYHMTMELSFTNHPYAGAYLTKKDSYSEMESVYVADTNAVYDSYFKYSFDRLPGKIPVRARLSSEEYLVFRTRTEVDEKGRLVSANYGKLHGELHFVGPRGLSFGQLAFNLKPNDPNLEDAETARRSTESRRMELELRRTSRNK